MTPAERQTIVRARRWARDNGWIHAAGCWTSPDGNLRVTWYPDLSEVGVARRHTADLWGGYDWLRVDSGTQAVDLLCAHGVLPAELSSAYAQGLLDGAATYAAAYQSVLARDAAGRLLAASPPGDYYARDDEPAVTQPLPAGVAGEKLGGRHG